MLTGSKANDETLLNEKLLYLSVFFSAYLHQNDKSIDVIPESHAQKIILAILRDLF